MKHFIIVIMMTLFSFHTYSKNNTKHCRLSNRIISNFAKELFSFKISDQQKTRLESKGYKLVRFYPQYKFTINKLENIPYAYDIWGRLHAYRTESYHLFNSESEVWSTNGLNIPLSFPSSKRCLTTENFTELMSIQTKVVEKLVEQLPSCENLSTKYLDRK